MNKSEETTPSAGEVMQALFQSTHHLHRKFEKYLSNLDIPSYLTGPRLRFLIAVAEADKIRMSEMAAKMGIQNRTVTQFVDALEQEKLLVRLPDPEDRRATLLQITEIAPPLIEKARLAMSESAEKVLKSLPVEKRGQLLDILDCLMDDKLRSVINNKEQSK